MRFIFLLFIICLSGCYSPTNIDDRVDEVVDSLRVNNDIISIHKEDRQDYWFYIFSNEIGPIYDEHGNCLVSEIRTIGNEDFIIYNSKISKDIDMKKVQNMESQYETPYHSDIWYFAITKDGKKEILYHPANSRVMPYAIPQIRNFVKSSQKTKDYEYIIDYVTIMTDDSIGITDISMNVNLYDRSGIYARKSLNPLFLVLPDSTYLFKVENLPLYDSYIDDTLWIADSCLIARYHIGLIFHDKKSLFRLNDRERIREMLNNSIFIKEEHYEVDLLIPAEAQIHLKRNGDWIDIP